MRYYCTYFDRYYLVKALALIESLNRFEKNEFRIFAVCLDEISRVVINALKPERVIAVPLHEIELRNERLINAKKNRTLVEYYFTLTPAIIRHLLMKIDGADSLTYLDADLFFFSSPASVFGEFDGHSVLIQPHRFSPLHRHREVWGKYNVGLISFRNDDAGMEVLTWWRDRCAEWCYARLEDGKYADQLYLDDWPVRFRNVGILNHIGAGVAPWNQEQYDYSFDKDGKIHVNGYPLIFYHFHSLAFLNRETVIADKLGIYLLSAEIMRLCYLPYIREIERRIAEVDRIFPDFTFGLNDDSKVADIHTVMTKKGSKTTIRQENGLHQWIELDDQWEIRLGIPPVVDMTDHASTGSMDKKATSLNEAGEILFEKGDIEGAIRLFIRAAESGEDADAAYNNLAVIAWQRGDNQSSMEYFGKALERNRSYRPAVINYAHILKETGQRAEIMQICRAYLKEHPGDKEIENLLDKTERSFIENN
jgi:tetratricopeptide (TPR) repeat protein